MSEREDRIATYLARIAKSRPEKDLERLARSDGVSRAPNRRQRSRWLAKDCEP